MPVQIRKYRKRETPVPGWFKLLWFSPVLIVAFIVKFPDWRRSYLLNHFGKETYAEIELVSLSGLRGMFDDKNILYTFQADGMLYTGFESAPVNQSCVFTPFGLTVEPRQKYTVRYYPDDPSIHRLCLDKPYAGNMLRYLEDVAEKLGEIPEFESLNPAVRLCIAVAVFKQYHFDGWANIMYFDEYLLENLSNNGYTYRNMIHSEEFKILTENCENM